MSYDVYTKAGADDAVSAAQATAETYADTVAGTAQTNAEATAAADATTKANAAEAAAETYADAVFTPSKGSNLSRFIKRCQAGRDVTVVAVGDSILEGTTVTADGGTLGVDDCLSRVATLTEARFGNTVTTSNRAKSGHTVMMGPLSLLWNYAVTDDPDLVLIDYGTNDISADIMSAPVPGYKMDDSIAGLERLFRRLRTDVPQADLCFIIANPYTAGSSSNPYKQAYNKRVLDVCGAYGVEVVDMYAAFVALGDYSGYMADTTHPNSAGHHLYADTVMAHLSSNYIGPGRLPAVMPTLGLSHPEYIDTSQGDTGVLYYLTPTSPMWVETGTWTDSGSYRNTTTAGDKISGTANFTELYALVDTTAALGLHATLKIDGSDVYTGADFTTGKQGGYWVPLVTGLAPGDHTYELILTAGTLSVDRVGWLAGAENVGVTTFNDDIAFQAIGSGTTLTAVTGTTVKLVDGTVTLPTGWNSADVIPSGFINHRITSATTTIRRFNCLVRINGVTTESHDFSVLPVTENTYTPPLTVSGMRANITADRAISLETKLYSADTTNCYASGWALEVMLIRRT